MPEKFPPGVKHLFKLHTLAYRVTGGLVGHWLSPSLRCLLLTTTGAKTGKERVSPLLYGRDKDRIVLIASQGGLPRNPPWYFNLKANPQVSVQIGRNSMPMKAREASGRERTRLWKLMVKQYGGYENYQRNTPRVIPVIVLEPLAATRS